MHSYIGYLILEKALLYLFKIVKKCFQSLLSKITINKKQNN